MIVTERVAGRPRIAVDHAGQGPLLLFLHGIGGNRTNWAQQLEHFGDRFHAVAWDLRGYGDSDDYEGPLTFADIRRDIERVLDHFGAAACHLVGLSLGGRIGFDFVRHVPRRVLSFAACSAVADAADMPPEDRKRFLERRMAPLLAGKTPAQMAPDVVRSLAGPHATAQVIQQLTDSIAALHTESYLKTLTCVSAPSERVSLHEIRLPVCVIAAEQDSLFPLAKVSAIAHAIPGARLSVLPGLGHLSNLEDPAAFNRALDAFLEIVQ